MYLNEVLLKHSGTFAGNINKNMTSNYYLKKLNSMPVILLLLLAGNIVNGQKTNGTPGKPSKPIVVPFEARFFDITNQKAEFAVYKGIKAMKILPGNGQVILKNLLFRDGTIEFDTQPVDVMKSAFVSVYFRMESAAENECVYLRTKPDEHEQRNDAVQYAPIIHGVNIWDLMGHYQAPAIIHNQDWNHIKLVISGLQMRVFVNDMVRPALQIPHLEGISLKGSLAFEGLAYFANLVVKPNAVEDLSPVAGADLTEHEANYIRYWQVTKPRFLDKGRELTKDNLPADTTKWEQINAERRGLINLTRTFGGVENRYGGVQDKDRFVWLKAVVHADKDQINQMQLGFSDEVSVFINGGQLYTDKNDYLQPIRKYPNGRCDIANVTFSLPLKAGDNEILIGVTNYFYGWGVIARLYQMDGIKIKQPMAL
jgi:hypothetical protein